MGPRVLMFGWEFPPHHSGGLGTACYGLSQALVERGASLIFVLPKRLGETFSKLKIIFADVDKVKFRRVPSLLYPYITSGEYAELKLSSPASGVYGPSLPDEVMAYGERARAIAGSEQFDVIHAHDWLSFPAGLAAKEASGKPLVVHVHATEFDRTGGNGINQAVYEIERAGMRLADRVVTVSNWTKQMVIKHYGIPENKIEVVHNGINLEEWRPLPDRLAHFKERGYKIVLFTGRITLQKGPDYFVRAAAAVLAHEPKVMFAVAGSGDMERQMIEEVAALGISDKFLFAGWVRGEELAALYRSADLYILPSVSEPFGITPLESLANGTPVLISKQSGVSEVLSHVLKADFWDIEDMTDKILSILRHPNLHQELRQGGRREVEGVTWARAAEKCINLYHSLKPA